MRIAALLVLAVGCSGSKSETTEDPVLVVEPEALSFGTVGEGQSSTLSLSVSNTGGGTIDVLSVTLTQGESDIWDLGILEDIAAGTTSTLDVTFSPDEESSFGGELQIRTDASGSVLVSLSGMGGPSGLDEDGDGFSPADGDCNDGDDSTYPGADELCDGQDNDCDGSTVDEEDNDGDGSRICDDDCDDDNSSVYPGAVEICDDLDTNCDSINADNDDGDGDGLTVCGGDCDDTNPSVSPNEAEVCDGVDNDCNSGIDDLDLDGDGHGQCSDAPDCDDNDPNAFPVVVDGSNGSGSGAGTSEDPLDSLTTALTLLDDVCHLVILRPGTYEFSAEPDGHLEVRGTGGPADVTLTAPGYERHLTVGAGVDATLENVTLTGGDSASDGGSVQITAGSLTATDVVFSGNQSANDGGAISVVSGTLTFGQGVRFDGNTASDDGGAIALDGSTLLDEDGTEYTGNSGARGGAIYAVSGSTTIHEALLDGNTAGIEGGGLALSGTGAFSIERNQIWRNTATAAGGGMALRDLESSTPIRNNHVGDNSADTGGGIAVVGNQGSAELHNNTVVGNAATSAASLLVDTADSSGMMVYGNILGWGSGAEGVFGDADADIRWNTSFSTTSGVEFAGAMASPLDPTNVSRNPELTNFSNDSDPTNDDLSLAVGSPEVDDGPPAPALEDSDGSPNDRGLTGGPGATP